MFHKFKKPEVYVNNSLVWPLKVLLIIAAIYFGYDIYEIVNSGVAEYRFSESSERNNDEFGFWLKIAEKFAYGAFCILISYCIQSIDKKEED